MSFSEQLKKARLAVGYTQQQVADAMGITNSTYCGYETGKRQPDVFKIKQLAAILKTSGDFLLETGFEDELRKEDIKTSPEPENTDSEDDRYEILGQKIYETLLSCGYVEEGQDLTDAQIDFLDGLSTIISSYFNGSTE